MLKNWSVLDPHHLHIQMMGRGNFTCEAQEKKLLWVGDIFFIVLVLLLLLLFAPNPLSSCCYRKNYYWLSYSTYGFWICCLWSGRGLESHSRLQRFANILNIFSFLSWTDKHNKRCKNLSFFISEEGFLWFEYIGLLYPFVF